MKKTYIFPNTEIHVIHLTHMIATSVDGFTSSLDGSTEIESGDLLSRESNNFWGSDDSENGGGSSAFNIWED